MVWGLGAPQGPVLTEPGELLEERTYPCSRKAQATKSEEPPPLPCCPRSGHHTARGAGSRMLRYWVLQSPSLLWAVFTFFSSF